MHCWQQLSYTKSESNPIIGLSPMDGVTDQPFRHIMKKYGQLDIVFTEFTSVEGVCHGAKQLLEDFLFDETQRPVIAQIYGTTPQFFRETAVVLCELGFDGIDINMGCPAKNVAHSGAGAALIKTPQLAQEIVRQTKAGVQDFRNGMRARDCEHIVAPIWQEVEQRHSLLPPEYQQVREIPVSVKTRMGYDQPVIEEWMATLLEVEPVAITVHGRTLKQHYSGQANWEVIGRGAEIVKKTQTMYLGNGDVQNQPHAVELAKTYGVDGVLIGRASFGNPYVFWSREKLEAGEAASSSLDAAPSIFEIALEHVALFEKTYQEKEKYSFLPMRKHLGWYVKAIPNAAEIRQKLFQTNTSEEVRVLFEEYGLL